MNSTETYWDVDGQSLQTYAFNITTLGGDRQAPPPVRRSSQRVPYMIGTRYTAGVPDEKTITLGMWVQGSDENGFPPTDEHLKRRWDRNWRMLRRLLWTPRRQFVLTKRFWLLTEELEAAGADLTGLPVDGDWTLYSASARGTYAGGLSPTMQGQAHGIFTVDILLNDPFFYGPEISIPLTTSELEGDPGPTVTVPILGDDRTMNIEVDFEGPLTSPSITNETEPQILYLRYANEIPDDETATVRVMPFTATHYPSGDPYGASGNVQHEGDLYWLYMEPGETTLTLEAQAGTGSAALRYRPAWV